MILASRRIRFGWPDAVVAAGLVASAAAVYLPRLLRGTGFSADTMKYHYIGAVFGISHPPGSPLYMLLDGLVARLPLGELAWRLNLFSAISAAGAVVFLYLLSRQISGSRVAAAMASAALLVAAMFWEQSLVAEVYTPHAVLFIASAWLLVRWHHDGRTTDLGMAAALYGLSFGIHVMSWFLLPLWMALTLAGPRTLLHRPREAVLVAAGALLGVSTYLYYVIRPLMHPAYVEFPIDGPRAFLDFVTGARFRPYMFAYDASAMAAERLPWLGTLAHANVGVPLLLLAGIGIVVLARDDRRLAVGLVLAIVLSAAYAMGYAVPDAHVDALPALYLTLALSAAGVNGLVDVIRAQAVTMRGLPNTAASGRVAPLNGAPGTVAPEPVEPAHAAKRVRSGRVAMAALAILVSLVAIERQDDVRQNAVRLDRSAGDRLADYGDRVFATVGDGATILTGSDPTFHALAYHTLGLGRGRTSHIRVLSHAGWPCARTLDAAERHLSEGPLYATMELTGCFTEAGYPVRAWDFSQTVSAYLDALPRGRLVLVAVQDEGTAGIDAGTWQRLDALGVFSGMRERFRWSYAAVLARTARGFTGLSDAGPGGATVVLAAGDRVAAAWRAPVSIAVRSGGQLSGRPAALVVDGVDYGRPNRGMQIVVVDGATGTPLERQVFDTHRTTSLRDLDFLQVLGRPAR